MTIESNRKLGAIGSLLTIIGAVSTVLTVIQYSSLLTPTTIDMVPNFALLAASGAVSMVAFRRVHPFSYCDVWVL